MSEWDTYVVQQHLLRFETLDPFAVGSMLDRVGLLDKPYFLHEV